jgi:membrane protease YdiL (CAAX protease family)
LVLVKRTPQRAIPSSALLLIVAITFAINWGIVGSFIVFPHHFVAWFGEISGSHPAFFLATWAPAIAAMVLVLSYGGISGLKAFLSRLRLLRCSPGWVAFVLFGLPIVFMVGSLIKGGPLFAPLPPEGAEPVFAVMFMMIFLGPVEEFGWRGVAQPLLQRHCAPIWAGLIIGVVWGVWHLPAFYLSGTVQSGWRFAPFFIGNVMLAILVTPLFNKARGSLLWPMLFHWQLINPFWPDAQPYDTWILVAVTAVAVWLNRETMFTRDKAVTKVIPPLDARRQ